MKYLVTILTSSNLELLKISYESVLNQKKFENYDIFIVINTMNELYYNKVIDYFSKINDNKLKKVIRTKSNGKPGMGHNSLLNIFVNQNNYEYLVILDGDDFLYPYTLDKINKLNQKNKFDILNLAGNTKLIRKIELIRKSNRFNININYEYIEFKNIQKIGDAYNKSIITPYRLICLNKEIFKYYDKLYDEEMICFDDYLAFLITYSLNDKLNIININDPYLYFYNKFNNDSVSKKENLDDDDSKCYILKEKFKVSKNFCNNIKIVPYNTIIKYEDNLNDIENFYKKIVLETLFLKSNKKSLLDYTNNINDKKIIFYSYINLSYDDINNKPLGGTESSIYFLSKELSKIYNINVLTKNNKQLIINSNLKYDNIKNLHKINSDYIITTLIDNNIIDYKNNINNNLKIIYWVHHDINVEFIKNYFEKFIKHVDNYIFVSEWQQNRYIYKYNIKKEKCIVIQNGISNNINKLNKYEKRKELIYISSPYRGLLPAYYLFQQIKLRIPNIRFKVFSSFNRDFNKDYNKLNEYKPFNDINEYLKINNNQLDYYYKSLYELLINDSQIDFYGSVPQNILFKHIQSSMVLFYPNTYPETCCNSLLECMANRCNIISSDLGALSETSKNLAILLNPNINQVLDKNYSVQNSLNNPININQLDNIYKDEFINKTVYLVNNYYSIENQKHLDKQQEYIFTKCRWKHKKEILETLL